MPRRRESGWNEDSLRVLARVHARLSTAHLLEAIVAGLACGALAGAVVRTAGWALMPTGLFALFVAGVLTAVLFTARRGGRARLVAAARLEQAVPDSHNVIVTAAELIDHPERASAWIRSRVIADANRVLGGVEPAVVIPLRPRIVLCALAAVAGMAVLSALDPQTRTSVTQTVDRSASGAPGGEGATTVVVTLEPPVHTGRPGTTIADPERINAIEGTRLTLRIARAVEPGRVRFANSELATHVEAGETVATLVLEDSGYLAIEGKNRTALIPVAVTPDRAPSIKVEKPGRDLLLPDAVRAIAVETTATDDFGLKALALRYTKVSGSGELFEFKEGDIPLGISRHDSRSWKARGVLDLGRLGLAAGDSIVYRVVAQDARPGDGGRTSSDTFFIEIAGPGQAALAGFEMPPDRERHAMSQQMIVLEIERLRERERQMPRDDVAEQAQTIAAEQRAVRANFVFLMGGHVEDEEEEAERSHEIQEGRLENTARRDISRAIGHMTHAEQGLVAIDTATALRQARLAVDALPRAFGRNRYILRTLPVRARIDPSRRLTGTLDEARDWSRKVPPPEGNARVEAIRDLLARVVTNAEVLTSAGATASAPLATRLIEQALAIDPANPAWQTVSVRFAALREAILTGATRETLEQKLEDAVIPLLAEIRRSPPLRPAAFGPVGSLRGAWSEELKRR